MIRKKVKIKNELGLHARAAAQFVKTCNKFSADIHVEKDNDTVNAKSIMGIMAMGISKGSEITLVIDGIDENEAMKRLIKLIDEDLLNL